MLKRWTLLLITGLLLTQVVGCGNKGNQESTEVIEESAVDNTTADSDNAQSEEAELPSIVEEQPAAEAVEEEAVFEAAELTCALPSGFKALQGEEGLYVHKSYPKDLATISYVISESTEDVTLMEKDAYKEMLEEDFYKEYGDEIEVSISQYEKIKVDGRNGLKVKLTYTLKGDEYEELIYMIFNGTESHIMSYTQEKSGKWMEEFEASGDSISLKAIE